MCRDSIVLMALPSNIIMELKNGIKMINVTALDYIDGVKQWWVEGHFIKYGM